MSSSDIALILRWLVPLWLLGWAVFPVSRRLFSFLPDQGLAAGRLGVLVAGALLTFWIGSIQLIPLSVTIMIGPTLAIAGFTQWSRAEAVEAVREHKKALLFSDCVFVLAFLFFVWVRLQHPSANDLEKPMDLALLASSENAQTLPFQHFWFEGVTFTNYYFFGPFMGGTLARLLVTSAPYAYNLVQPLFCALFLSVLWSVGAALSKSKWLGLGVMALVGLGGHLEPLRQLREGTPAGQLDWWKTSRVIENTINEYPSFSMLIGDAHAHFYAFSLAALHFGVCLGIVCVDSPRQRAVLAGIGGVLLGVFALTNTWDLPLYGVLWVMSVAYARQKQRQVAEDTTPPLPSPGIAYALTKQSPERELMLGAIAGVLLSAAFILPFFAQFRSQVGGGGFMLWIPNAFSFLLFWGGWIALGAIAFGFWQGRIEPSRAGDFRKMLLAIGVVSLLFPSIYYIGGVFAGGDFRHQDTVFKFYLQAWLLGGTAIASEFFLQLRQWGRRAGSAFAIPAWGAMAVFAVVLTLAPYATWKTRTQGYGEPGLSLDGGKWLSQSDHQALAWLTTQNGVVAEQMPADRGGDYDANRGTLATQSGLPSVLCWPGHVRAWGFQNDLTRAAAQQAGASGKDPKQAQAESVNQQVDERINDLNAIYTGDANARRVAAKKYGVSFIVIRPDQQPFTDPNFQAHEFSGEDGSKTYIMERKGF